MKLLTIFAVIVLIPACAYAVDGVVLINQATVTAAGGFPYIISQPGSYKLSGNLTMNTTSTGNYQGSDVAILINANGVVLDLNGFSVIVNNSDPNIAHIFYGVFAPNVNACTLKNGSIMMTPLAAAVGFHLGAYCSVEEVSVSISNFVSGTTGGSSFVGPKSVIRRSRFNPANVLISCPSVVVDSTGISPLLFSGSGCVAANTVP